MDSFPLIYTKYLTFKFSTSIVLNSTIPSSNHATSFWLYKSTFNLHIHTMQDHSLNLYACYILELQFHKTTNMNLISFTHHLFSPFILSNYTFLTATLLVYIILLNCNYNLIQNACIIHFQSMVGKHKL
jgi:hypothetical protein